MTPDETRRALELLRCVRRFMAAGEKHARLLRLEKRQGLYEPTLIARGEVDDAHATLVARFTARDVAQLAEAIKRGTV